MKEKEYCNQYIDLYNMHVGRPLAFFTLIFVSTMFLSVYVLREELEKNWMWVRGMPMIFLICASIYLMVVAILVGKGRHIPHAFCMLGSSWYMIAVLGLGICATHIPYGEKEGVAVFILTSFIATAFMIMPKQFMGMLLLIADLLLFGSLFLREEIVWNWQFDSAYIWISIMFFCTSVIRYKQISEISREKFQLEKRIKELNQISRFDELTGLKNRYALLKDVDYYMGRELLVAMIDLDNFKAINDTYGHDAGDDILMFFAQLMKNTFGIDYCYRLGGDEFLIILPELPKETFRSRAAVFSLQLNEFSLESYHMEASCSIGVALGVAEDYDKFLKIKKEADCKVYEAKSAGKGLIIL